MLFLTRVSCLGPNIQRTQHAFATTKKEVQIREEGSPADSNAAEGDGSIGVA
jgi:hypothetical protein